jgi:hypothetical protein
VRNRRRSKFRKTMHEKSKHTENEGPLTAPTLGRRSNSQLHSQLHSHICACAYASASLSTRVYTTGRGRGNRKKRLGTRKKQTCTLARKKFTLDPHSSLRGRSPLHRLDYPPRPISSLEKSHEKSDIMKTAERSQIIAEQPRPRRRSIQSTNPYLHIRRRLTQRQRQHDIATLFSRAILARCFPLKKARRAALKASSGYVTTDFGDHKPLARIHKMNPDSCENASFHEKIHAAPAKGPRPRSPLRVSICLTVRF